ncbi:tetratricopeptide repeat protein [uncultured Polaribacter sp.]|uniref:tetratricopeptide repeat protein n=1 Tax=uncultured Polaribacter sp. TaxID=174711 RepID=UPI002625DCA1|nr:tetratricopeptide repeat protein [uncultured Polaribacter sp.]
MSEALQCSSCGGANQLPAGKSSMFCAFCGNAIEKKVETNGNIPKPEDNPQIKNFLELAGNAKESGNYEEAINYYNKAIEFDIKLPEAWFGKGYCSGWSGNLRIIKISEMVRNFKKALDYTIEKEEMKKRIAQSIDGCAFAVYNLSYNHTVEFATVDGTYQEHLHRSIDVLDALEYAHSLDTTSKHILDSLVQISENLLTPIRFKDYDDNYGSLKMDGRSQEKVNTIRLKYSSILAKSDKNYAASVSKKAGTGNTLRIIGAVCVIIAFILFKSDVIFISILLGIGGIASFYYGNNMVQNYKGISDNVKYSDPKLKNDGVLLTRDSKLIENKTMLKSIEAFSGWGGAAENLGIKNAEKKLVKKAKEVGGSAVLIIRKTEPMGGVKLFGKVYK